MFFLKNFKKGKVKKNAANERGSALKTETNATNKKHAPFFRSRTNDVHAATQSNESSQLKSYI